MNPQSSQNVELSNFVRTTAKESTIPGVAVGVWADGQVSTVCHGVTNVENPLPVDEDTLFVVGSVTKTYTATALMCLVAQSRIELEAPVRLYIPELVLADERAAAEVTVLNLLNHTSGLDWRVEVDSGEGDDALAREVAALSGSTLIAPPGTRFSYSQAGYDLLGRIVEKVTGETYERAMASLVFEPLKLEHSFFNRDDVMTRRFATGHNPDDDGKPSVARPWRHWRSDNPGGGLASSVADQLRWARFHLGDGRAESGTPVLSPELLHRMKEPTVALRGSSLGDALGIGWFLRQVDRVQTVGHGGSANGQFADFLLVPERNFAVVAMSNAGPNGTPFNQTIIRWALQNYLGSIDRDPEPLPYDKERAREVVGSYGNDYMIVTIVNDGEVLTLDARIRPEVRAGAESEPPPDVSPADIGLLSAADEFIVAGGYLKGQRGFFTRDGAGMVVGVDLAGRLFSRISQTNRAS
jgi:CubicO group peptidase (beta-lactamase class C family)